MEPGKMPGSECRRDRYVQVASSLYRFLAASVACEPSVVESALDSLRIWVQRQLDQETSLIIQARHGFLFLNGVRVPVSGGGFSAITHLVGALHRMGLAGFSFEGRVSSRDLRGLAELFDSECADLVAWQEFSSITPLPLEAEPPPEMEQAVSSDLRDTYFQEVFLVRRLLDSLGSRSPVAAVVTKSILQGVAEDILANEALLALSRDLLSRDHQEVGHAAAVAVTAVGLGAQLQLPASLLRQIGVAGLFYNMGCDPRTFWYLLSHRVQLDDLLMRTMLVCARSDGEDSDGEDLDELPSRTIPRLAAEHVQSVPGPKRPPLRSAAAASDHRTDC